MRRYVARRLGQAVLVLWAAYTLSFALLSALPGDAVSNRIKNPDAQISPEAGRMLLDYYGLDRPLWELYVHGLWSALRGDLGFSLSTGSEVTSLVADALPSTLQLTGLALVVAVLLAVAVALVANYAPWRWVRSLAESVPALFASVPTFVVGILALQYLSFRFHLVPAVDDGTPLALVAPAVTLGIVVAAPLSQVLTASIAGTRRQPFVHVLQAKGAGEGYIFRKDVLRNSSLPVLTLLGLAVGELIAGSVVTEAVYARPGIGQLTVGAVQTQDLPVVQGVVLLSTAAYVAVNLAVDLAYPLIDPRILVDGRARSSTRARGAAAEVVAGEPVVPVPPTGAVQPTPSGRRGLPVEVAMP
ncbi:peptide/nickel transport system permease protein [Nocardioides zeae]|uniref:Peptide/nickel transport system permease protein n=1 Tax=Nocardioides zeae TaxID=1457234 RepID=A0ACC6ILX5_9ACTN|nr:ABC transporter permease [Nocardioides zeae]MDR6175027.1 peptide/nickel transport system permease protein [Nocardioides zeae]MDR6211605.1 peptide/nickel transport system permease protein [Nocardioides zeae]